jgi:hypothetical protein
LTITNINNIQIKRCVVDELHVRSSTNSSVNLTSSKDTWQIDTYLLTRFQGNLEAGTIDNGGLQITQFAIKRRKTDEITPITLGYVPYQVGTNVTYTDYAQANDTYIYSIVPVGENGLFGVPNEISVTSDFTGWWIVDKDTNKTLSFDKAIGNLGDMETTFNQGRVEIKTLSKYPQYYYYDEQYHNFTLSGVFIPSENERSSKEYFNILNNFIKNHKPYIVKSGDGRIFICDISNLKVSNPQNTWQGYDYIHVQIDCTEIEDYETFMTE